MEKVKSCLEKRHFIQIINETYNLYFKYGARSSKKVDSGDVLRNDEMSPLFLATIEATEEAIINSLFIAESMTGNGRTVEALEIEKVMPILRKYGVIK